MSLQLVTRVKGSVECSITYRRGRPSTGTLHATWLLKLACGHFATRRQTGLEPPKRAKCPHGCTAKEKA